MSIIYKHRVTSISKKKRLSDYLIGKIEDLPSRKSVKKAITNQEIFVNGGIAHTGYWVQLGDEIKWNPKNKWPAVIYQLKIPIVYEDDDIAVINKPGGIPVSGNSFRNVQNCLGYFLNISAENSFYPQSVHRLDAATCGLLIIAKNRSSRIALGKQFEVGLIQKKYHAIVMGHVADGGSINLAIDSKESQSLFKCIARHTTKNKLKFSHLVLTPKTGRTHQLRKHCLYMGHPILGDQLYGNTQWKLKGKGLLLCATFLSFAHPKTNESLTFQISTPAKFDKVMKKP